MYTLRSLLAPMRESRTRGVVWWKSVSGINVLATQWSIATASLVIDWLKDTTFEIGTS